jgi:hypothetical protein
MPRPGLLARGLRYAWDRVNTMNATIAMERTNAIRRGRWQTAAVLGLGIAMTGILLGASGFATRLPVPTWGLAAAALAGLLLAALAGGRLISLRTSRSTAERRREIPMDDAWLRLSVAFQAVRSGRYPVLSAPEKAAEQERAAFEQANEAFQYLARRQRVVRAAIDELRGEFNNYYRYLTKSQVGLIGANSVAERLEKFEERLAKIRSVM